MIVSLGCLRPIIEMLYNMILTFIIAYSALLFVQGTFALYLMLYTWMRSERVLAVESPRSFSSPALRFAVLLPCKNEEKVIAETIRRVCEANYPKELMEIAVICQCQDEDTIAEAQRAAANYSNARVVVMSDETSGKAHALNVGLSRTTHEVITIFDAEDDVQPQLFQVINTIMQRDNVAVVQAGCQLMDYRSSWFAVHNVLEYYFWFRSSQHFHAQVGAVPLGGNTVFIQRRLLEMIGGWDEQCLTEDADIGVRLSLLGEKITVTYDAEHATREETPPTLASFIRQRTRWNQGFLQVLKKKDWCRLPTTGQRLLALYTLSYPAMHAFMFLVWIPLVLFMPRVPLAAFLLLVLPLYVVVLQYVVTLIGFLEFGTLYRAPLTLRDIVVFSLGFLPYQGIMYISALRAMGRELYGIKNWEKTAHFGTNRQWGKNALSTSADLQGATAHDEIH